ncbi:MAG: hypothetical protein WCF30_18370 [Terracidiphilus sp.]
MRRSIVALLLVLCAPALVCGQESNPDQNLPKAKAKTEYPLKVHLSDLQMRNQCSGNGVLRVWACDDVIYASATIDGRKTELMGYRIWSSDEPVPLIPGDYQARFLKGPKPAGPQMLGEKYELVLPDRTVWQCTVTGISE